MPIGTVAFYHHASGFGVIRPEKGGPDAFVHVSAVQVAGLASLQAAQRISYELRTDARGQTCAHALFCPD